MSYNDNRQWLVEVPRMKRDKFDKMILNFEPYMQLIGVTEFAPCMYMFQGEFKDIQKIADFLYDERIEHAVYFMRRVSWKNSFDKGYMKAFKDKNAKFAQFGILKHKSYVDFNNNLV